MTQNTNATATVDQTNFTRIAADHYQYFSQARERIYDLFYKQVEDDFVMGKKQWRWICNCPDTRRNQNPNCKHRQALCTLIRAQMQGSKAQAEASAIVAQSQPQPEQQQESQFEALSREVAQLRAELAQLREEVARKPAKRAAKRKKLSDKEVVEQVFGPGSKGEAQEARAIMEAIEAENAEGIQAQDVAIALEDASQAAATAAAEAREAHELFLDGQQLRQELEPSASLAEKGHLNGNQGFNLLRERADIAYTLDTKPATPPAEYFTHARYTGEFCYKRVAENEWYFIIRDEQQEGADKAIAEYRSLSQAQAEALRLNRAERRSKKKSAA